MHAQLRQNNLKEIFHYRYISVRATKNIALEETVFEDID
jgi:hypothetical protein